MSYLRLNVGSQALSRYVDVSVVIPIENYSYFPPETPRHHVMPGMKMKPQFHPGMQFQTIYVLQAGEADDFYMFRHTGLEQYARDNNVMLVCPGIANSFGVDTAYGIEYAAFISEELPAIIQTLFPSSPKREDNFVIGAAAGGNAALYNAVRYPEKFAVGVDISGGIGEHFDPANRMNNGRMASNFPIAKTTFADISEIVGSIYDMDHLTRKNQEEGKELAKIIFVHGSEEGRIGEAVRLDAEAAKALGYDTEYICIEGGLHNDAFWDEQFKATLDTYLPLKRTALNL